ncbi:MAG: hypothetical protein H7144_00385 [Burkholderiales bacterium]|nr:hypothetical protein [Phycisphaerae bacterium]
MGWESLQNGKLLAAAATAFDVLVTLDQNIKHQQNLANLPITVIVLIGRSNRLRDLTMLVQYLEPLLSTTKVGSLMEINFAGEVTVLVNGRDGATL